MPKHNPNIDKSKNKIEKEKTKKKKTLKHNPNVDKQRKGTTGRYIDEGEDIYEGRGSYTQIYMVLVFIAVVLAIAVLVIFVFNVEATRIEKYDIVQLDYEVYSLEQYQDHEDPEIKKTNKWVNACHRYDDDCEGDLIKGFYNKLLDKKEGDVVNYELIEGCKDLDKDGKDDKTGDDALSYGFEDDDKDLRYQDIVLWFKVIKINKSGSSDVEEAESSSLHHYEEIKHRVLEIFNFALFRRKEELLVA